MSPDIYLQFAGVFISYFIRISVAWLTCLLLSRLVGSPRQKFAIWRIFIVGSLGYWLYLAGSSASALYVPAAASTAATRYTGLVSPDRVFVATRFQHSTVILAQILGYVYVAGMLLLVTAGIWKRIRLHLLLRRGTAPSAELRNLFAEMCRQFGLRHCELLILEGVSSPATVYWWRPRIVLPQACEQLGNSDLMADILSHELAHVVRRDYLWSSANGLICCLLFFHPAVWQARKQMRIHREMACDLAVVSARPEHRADYAQTLMSVARLCLPRRYPVIGIDFAASPSLLTDRVLAILSQPERRSWNQRFSRAAACLLLAGAYALLSPVIGIVLAFSPSSRTPRIAEVQAPNSQTHAATRQKIRREQISAREEKSLITAPTVYRLQAIPDPRSYGPATSVSEARESADLDGPGGLNSPVFKPASSPGTTVRSIIVATVGAVAGPSTDKDVHPPTTTTSGGGTGSGSKQKPGSHP